MAHFMRIKYENPKLKQSEIANQLGYSSTLQRYRNDKNMLSPYRRQTNNTNKRTKKTLNTNFDSNSYREHDVKRPQMTLKQLKQIQNQTKKQKNSKSRIHAGECPKNEHSLDEILDNNDL